jgi:hypothetical protein
MSLVAAYSFNEGTGTTVADASGNGNTGTISGATWTTAGKYGGALVFNGTNARVTIPDSASLHLTTGMTLEAWVNPSVVTGLWRDVIYKGNDNYFLEATNGHSGSAPAAGVSFGSTHVITYGSVALTANTWTHLAVTYDGATLRLYVNGVQASSLAQTGTILTSSNPLSIGGDTFYGQYFQGMIDEVRVYNVALTAAQIQADMNTPIAPDTQPPTAPSNLKATAVSGSQINLSWTAATDNVKVTGYRVERQNPGSTSFVQVGTATGTTYSNTGLSANSSYSYRVRATDAAGNLSPYSNVASATTPASNPTATTYTLTPPVPTTGVVGVASGPFTVALPTGQAVAAPVTVTPNDGGAKGTFTPAQEILSNTSPSATFTYTAASVGTDTIATTNTGGLNNPAPVTFTASSSSPGVTYSLSGPASGEVGRSATCTLTLGTGTIPGTIHFTFSASNGDGTFSPTALDLTNTVRSGTFTYTPQRWGTRTIAVTNNGGLTNPAPLSFVSKVQLGSSGTAPSRTQCPNLGGFNFFTKGGWWKELGRTVSSDAVNAKSASLLSSFFDGTGLRTAWWSSTANGGNSMYGDPYNVVPGTQPLLPVTISEYASESDPGNVPFFDTMTIQGWDSTNPAPTVTQVSDGGDHHGWVCVRNETTGGIDKLYEYYQVATNDGGSTWHAAQGSQFDLTTGAPRTEGWTSSDAAGLAFQPLLVLYDDALNNRINHPIRMIIPTGASCQFFVWPARHSVYGGSSDPNGGLPMGARLRLSSSWYNANINNFSPINRAVVTALHVYGGIVADLGGSGLWIDGTNDQRWDADDLNWGVAPYTMGLQNIPVSAFELLDTIKSPISFTGPSSGPHGTAVGFTVTHLIPADSNFLTNVYLSYSSDGGTNWSDVDYHLMNDTNRGPFNLYWTPASAGTYLLKVHTPSLDWIPPAMITFKAS